MSIMTSAMSSDIKAQITKTFKEMKTELFESNGKIFDRNWDDLTPKYKKYKAQKKGSAYPINVFTGKLLEEVLEHALVVDCSYDELTDDLTTNISVDLSRVNVEYAKDVNDSREYITFSDEEKDIINKAVVEVLKRYYGE